MKYPEQESHILEFKRDIPQNDQIIKTIIGFCNQAGGRLILGVEDDGTIIGLAQDTILEMLESLEKSIYEASSPPIIPHVMTQLIGDKSVLVIAVSAGMNKPYYRRSEGLGNGTYIRIGRNTIRANSDMIEELRWQSRGLCFDAMPVYNASKEDLDEKKIGEFFQKRTNGAVTQITEELLRSYKLITEEHAKIFPTAAGILCFGRNVNYFFSEAMIICTHFAGISGREVIATRDCVGNLFEQFEESYAFVLSRLNRSFTIKEVKREEKYEIPPIALREILLNAIIHRNYHLRAPTKIAIYADRIEIFSPGGFPTPFTNIHLGMSDIRNTTLCKLFREARYIEKLGSGFITVFNSYAEYNLPAPEVINRDNFVKCILPRESYGVSEYPDEMQMILKLFASATDLAVSEVMQALGIPRATAVRRLNVLVQSGKLKKHGKGKSTRYRLK